MEYGCDPLSLRREVVEPNMAIGDVERRLRLADRLYPIRRLMRTLASPRRMLPSWVHKK